MALKPWVLLVDDDPALLKMMEDFVHGPAFRTTTASDARQAFIQARDLRPALVISDMQMPGFYGVAALTELRKDARTRDIPFLFVTGMDPAKAAALLPPNDPKVRLLSKPIDWDRLEKLVTEMTGFVVGPEAP